MTLTGFPAATVSEAFDEPISGAAALSIISLFIRGGLDFPPEPPASFSEEFKFGV